MASRGNTTSTTPSFDSRLGHAEHDRGRFVLGDGETAVALEQAQAQGSVVAHACENDGHGSPGKPIGRRAKQIVDGRPAVVLGRIVGDLDAGYRIRAGHQAHLPAARRNQAPSRLRTCRRPLPRAHASCTCSDRLSASDCVKMGGMCWTTAMGTPRSLGKSGSRRASAAGPPGRHADEHNLWTERRAPGQSFPEPAGLVAASDE
jgi:hypothetical protein